jgi:hypothetical protein
MTPDTEYKMRMEADNVELRRWRINATKLLLTLHDANADLFEGNRKMLDGLFTAEDQYLLGLRDDR